MRDYGTRVVGGVTPGKGGQRLEGIPVFDSVKEAVAATQAEASVIFVPAAFASAALKEAADSELKLIVCITEGIPVLEMIENCAYLEKRNKILIGPNCPGLISPGKAKIGIMPGPIHRPGRIGVISRSGTLTYEIVHQLTRAGLGQSSCIGIGGDPVTGEGFISLLSRFEKDEQTDGVVIIGEIGGDAEEKMALWAAEHFSKKLAAFIAGRTAPAEKRMGHAGAIISGSSGTAAGKVKVLEEAGIIVADRPDRIPEALKRLLRV
jgi:succinyl-CoA synthetase alpha subunit